MKFLPSAATLKMSRQILLAQKHSPTMLFASGMIGFVATVVLASKATLKVDEILEKTSYDLESAKSVYEDASMDYLMKDYRQDQVVIYSRSLGSVAKLYAPALAVGIFSIACLTGSHKILTNRNAGLMAAYAGLEKGFDEYRRRVRDEYGDDKERELRYDTKPCEISTDGKKSEIVRVPTASSSSIYARFFDEYCKEWQKTPEYNLVFVKCQQNYANDMLQARGHVFLNEVYDSLGIPRTKAGAVVGWIISDTGDNYVDFGLYENDNERARAFVNGREGSMLLDFNVDGVIFDKI